MAAIGPQSGQPVAVLADSTHRISALPGGPVDSGYVKAIEIGEEITVVAVAELLCWADRYRARILEHRGQDPSDEMKLGRYISRGPDPSFMP